MTSKSLWVLIFAVLLNSFVTSHSLDIGSEEYCTETFGLTKVEFGGTGDIWDHSVLGEQGAPGLKGDQGHIGIPGTAGKCSCPGLEEKVDVEKAKQWGKDEDNVAVKTCRNAPPGVDGLRYIYQDNPMKVLCDSITKKTCPKITTTGKEVTYTESKPFWLSEKFVTLKDIYGLTSNQLLWLQRESYSANLTIRYHCKNSIPVGEHALALLTWNDMIVGPTSTESASFYYYAEKDGCSLAKEDTWSSTDIVLVSPSVDRLPIIDFYVKDVRNGNQALRIEILELCFG